MTDTSIPGGAPLARADLDRAAALNRFSPSRISWGAVFAGVALALTVQFALNLLGVGVGAAVIDPGTSDNPGAAAFTMAGGLWYVAAALIGAFAGGYVASRLSGRAAKTIGGLHGLTAWAATTLVVLYLLTTSIGALVGGAFSGLTSVIGGVGGAASSAVQAAAPSIAAMNPLQQIETEVRQAGAGQDPEALRSGAAAAVQAVLTGDPAKADEARTRAAEALARAQNISPEQARAQVGQYEERYRATVAEAKRQAQAAAATTAKVVSRGALLGFIALALAAIAAWLGGAAGAPRATRAARRV
ncbi:PhnA-like protein [Methylopila sp. Yamaguchi]|uniref:PhnA-like protein n=1 Tax=Methylopila sp. Yamaguchi TaxID=1437817 RepID=UPI000CAB9AB2|nr:PhnA-like protein [Methylopila sp. Yamaguchi]GBD47343.1 hypothetical protein METY_0556 [Methylopila sp. Yamaguchi]